MKRNVTAIFLSIAISIFICISSSFATPANSYHDLDNQILYQIDTRALYQERSPIYRFWSNQTESHFFTIDEDEKNYIIAFYSWYTFEGIAYYAYKTNNQPPEAMPVYRFFNTDTKSHFYTISETEKNTIIENYAWYTYEGIAWYAFDNEINAPTDALPVYRFFNLNTGCHFYTISETEKDTVIANYDWYRYEGVSWYAFIAPGPPVDSQWSGASTTDQTAIAFSVSGESVTNIELTLDMKYHPPLSEIIVRPVEEVTIVKDTFTFTGTAVDLAEKEIKYEITGKYLNQQQWMILYQYDDFYGTYRFWGKFDAAPVDTP